MKRRRPGILRLLVLLAICLLAAPAAVLLVYLAVPPPVTPLMLIRDAEGAGRSQTWMPLDRIAPALQRAVIAAEDAKFCQHRGFDWDELDKALQDAQAGQASRGASTITMQTAKNLFLWPGRSFLRKGIEAYITVLIEVLWPKSRTFEVYLNIIEWGDGLYGAEAAAQAHFGKAAAALSQDEAARLAAVLPNPRRFSASAPTPYVSERAGIIRARMGSAWIPGTRGC